MSVRDKLDVSSRQSLAFPLYFASRGVGTVQSITGGAKSPYTVKAKVYLSGLGADE